MQDLRQKLLGLDENKKIIMLTRKFNAIEEKKAVGFPKLPTITVEENVDDILIHRKIIED